MLTAIFAFWGGLPGPLKKIAEYAGIAVLVLLLVRWYSNKAYEKGVASGRTDAVADIQKAKEKEWAQKESELNAKQGQVDASAKDLDAKLKATVQTQAAFASALSNKLNSINTNRENLSEKINTIPASELDGALRSISAELKTSN